MKQITLQIEDKDYAGFVVGANYFGESVEEYILKAAKIRTLYRDELSGRVVKFRKGFKDLPDEYKHLWDLYDALIRSLEYWSTTKIGIEILKKLGLPRLHTGIKELFIKKGYWDRQPSLSRQDLPGSLSTGLKFSKN